MQVRRAISPALHCGGDRNVTVICVDPSFGGRYRPPSIAAMADDDRQGQEEAFGGRYRPPSIAAPGAPGATRQQPTTFGGRYRPPSIAARRCRRSRGR